MRIRIWFTCILMAVVLISGCARQPGGTAGLVPVTDAAGVGWDISANVISAGEGNLHRVVTGNSLGADNALELAAGGQGTTAYFREIAAGKDAAVQYRLQFLSTQGTGRIKVAALDEQGNILGSAGWIFTGAVPAPSVSEKWLDVRYQANYVGDWIAQQINLHDFIGRHLPVAVAAKASRYRFSVETGEGQHVLITQAALFKDLTRVTRLTPAETDLTNMLGDVVTVSAVLENTGAAAIDHAWLEAIEPYGSGLICADTAGKEISGLSPGEKRTVFWQVKAQRPHAVNLNNPWSLKFKINGQELPSEIKISVADPRPGQLFYVMTEDLEPIDAAGYPVAWGNANGWLEPEELVVQMVRKAEALNAIAEKYGAKWTHYTAFPVIKAAEWAAGQSSSGKWTEAVAAIRQSISRQAAKGHEYSLHLHMDYDAVLPGNVLSYNSKVDGLWANHLRHGWAHSIGAEGSFRDAYSRTGSLFRYQAMADELSAGSPLGQLITARVGSFDFGSGSASEALSTRAYRKVGLWGSSDADGNAGGVTAAAYGQEIYFAKPDDINQPADNIQQTGLVEFRPTPRSFITYDSQTAAELNRRAAEGVAFFTEGPAVKSGVHAIIGFTHAMFILGQGDWRSTEGGQFNSIEEHLRHLKTTYADQGIITFGTANDLVKAYLDYYSPTLVAVYGARTAQNMLYSEYRVELLGRDIPVDTTRPQQLSVKYPLYLRDSAYLVKVLKNGQEIYATTGLPTPYNDIVFTVDDKTAAYSIKIYHNRGILKLMEILRMVKSKIFLKS